MKKELTEVVEKANYKDEYKSDVDFEYKDRNNDDKDSPLADFKLEENIFTREEADIIVSQNEKGDFSTITEALEKAKAGDKIFIEHGSYEENFSIDKAVKICGDEDDMPVVVFDSEYKCNINENCFVNYIHFDSFRESDTEPDIVDGMIEIFSESEFVNCIFSSSISNNIVIVCPDITPRFYNCDICGAEFAGIALDIGTTAIIKNCRIYNNGNTGIYVREASPIVEGCNIYNIWRDEGEKGCGIAVMNGKGIYKNCAIHDITSSGIYIEGNGDPVVENCNIFDCHSAAGIYLLDESEGTYINCKIHNIEGKGIFVFDSANPTVENCEIYDCHINFGEDTNGIKIQGDRGGHYKNCEIHNLEGAGILVIEDANPTVENCEIYNIVGGDGFSGRGIVITQDSKGIYKDCTIHDIESWGVVVKMNAGPVLENCDIYYCSGSEDFPGVGIYFLTKKTTIFTNCKIHHITEGVGIAIDSYVHPTLNNCEVYSIDGEEVILNEDSDSEDEEYDDEKESDVDFDEDEWSDEGESDTDFDDEEYDKEDDFIVEEGVLIGYQGSESSIFIPSTVTSIKDGVFDDAIGLESITVPASVTFIGDYAFCYAFNLREINVDENNPNYSSINGVLYNKEITKIITIPKEKRVVTLPATVNSYGQATFETCNRLKAIKVDENNPIFSSFAGSLYNKEITKIIKNPSDKTEVILPDSVTEIEDVAFAYNFNLKKIKLPKNLLSIGQSAFYDCHDLESIIIPEGITALKDHTFSNCESLKSIVIPESVTRIEDRAFESCSSIQSITIPCNVSYIGDSVFDYCENLKSIKIDKNNKYYHVENGIVYNKANESVIDCSQL